MIVSALISKGAPLSLLKTGEMEAVLGHLIGPPPTTESLFGQYGFRLESNMLEDVRFRLCVFWII